MNGRAARVPGSVISMAEDDPEAGAGPHDSIVGRVEARLASGHAQGPVESPADYRVAVGKGTGYAAGIAVGVAGLAVIGNAWLGVWASHLGTWPSRGKLWALASSSAWRWGTLVGLVLLVGLAHLLARRGRRWAPFVAAAACLLVVGVSAYAVGYRVDELTGGWTFYEPESLAE
jgi:MFS family permease